VHHDGSEALVKWALVERLIGLALGAREVNAGGQSLRAHCERACSSRKRQSSARVSSNSPRSSAHSAMMLSRVRSKLAHDGVRNAVQLTVAELAAVESHPCSHPQWVLRKNGASAVVDARVWLAFLPLGMVNKCR